MPNYLLDCKTLDKTYYSCIVINCAKYLYIRGKRFTPFCSQIRQYQRIMNNKIIAFLSKIRKNCQYSNKTFTPLISFSKQSEWPKI